MKDEFKQLITQHSTFISRRRRLLISGELRIEDAEKMVGEDV